MSAAPTFERAVLLRLLPLDVLRHRVVLPLASPQLGLQIGVVCVPGERLVGLADVVLHPGPLLLGLLQTGAARRQGDEVMCPETERMGS